MNKTDNRHYNRSEKRILGIEMDYWIWYHDKETEFGIIDDVKYEGNSVYGNVYVHIRNKWYVVVRKDRQYRPSKFGYANILLHENYTHTK